MNKKIFASSVVITLILTLIVSVESLMFDSMGWESDALNILLAVVGLILAIMSILKEKGVNKLVSIALAIICLYLGIVALIRVLLSDIGYLG